MTDTYAEGEGATDPKSRVVIKADAEVETRYGDAYAAMRELDTFMWNWRKRWHRSFDGEEVSEHDVHIKDYGEVQQTD